MEIPPEMQRHYSTKDTSIFFQQISNNMKPMESSMNTTPNSGHLTIPWEITITSIYFIQEKIKLYLEEMRI